MDDKDHAILRIIERVRSDLSSRAVAEEAGLPISTVHRRIKQMEHDGVIRGYRAVIDYEKTEQPIVANLLVKLRESTPEQPRIPKTVIMEKLRTLENVRGITNIQGFNFDLIARVRCGSIRALASLAETLTAIDGVERVVMTLIVEEVIV
jgi:Lrp/AsnC family leucine-responsive transcriptional regulator